MQSQGMSQDLWGTGTLHLRAADRYTNLGLFRLSRNPRNFVLMVLPKTQKLQSASNLRVTIRASLSNAQVVVTPDLGERLSRAFLNSNPLRLPRKTMQPNMQREWLRLTPQGLASASVLHDAPR
jgi:hypothetical protein